MIVLDQVDFSYPDGRKVLDRLSLSLPGDGAVCLFGPSGCGKTTLLRLLAGLEKPQSGRITGLDGLRVSMVFQENRLLPWETVLENTLLAGGTREQAAALLERLGLGGALERYPRELSGGMKRRAAIARALLTPGDLLILDEPFEGLETGWWSELAGEIRRRYAGKPVVLVTHIEQQAALLGAGVRRFAGPPLRAE